MNKNELKKVLKPLIKECIKEVMFEDGTLSTVISEVVKGLGTQTITESRLSTQSNKNVNAQEHQRKKAQKLQENRKRMLDAIGRDSYNGVNVFEGTTPAPAESQSKHGALSGMDPKDPGVDISSLVDPSRASAWKKIIR